MPTKVHKTFDRSTGRSYSLIILKIPNLNYRSDLVILLILFDIKMNEKGMMEYMSEMNRLFPRFDENDIYQSETLSGMSSSPLFTSATANTSSSADSISPESYPDLSAYKLTGYQSIRDPQQNSDTPFIIRRQRPIVGRKIFINTPRVEAPRNDPPMYHNEDIPANNYIIRQKNHPQNVYYELFPTESKQYEFKSPVKNLSSPTSALSQTSDSSTSNCFQNYFSPNFSSPKSTTNWPSNSEFTPAEFIRPSTSRIQSYVPTKLCTFCRKNGETPMVYTTHTVKEKIGNKNVVTCPILRSHVCSTCGMSGDDAHTITYCPILRRTNHGQPLQSTTITLKNTRIKSNGALHITR